MKDLNPWAYRVEPGEKVRLKKWDPEDKQGIKKEDGLKELEKLRFRLDPLQELLFAEHAHKLLVVLQGMDTSGKDGTIRRVFEGVNPDGVRVAHFGPPTQAEKDRDFLWRVHQQVPASGEIVIFNRSHYEGVLIERVHRLVPTEVWRLRYDEIVEFERILAQEGTTILKFYLNIDEAEQKERIEQRLKDPTKEWKFSQNDLPEREYWDDYIKAYEEAIWRTSTKHAPWYVVPSNHGWFRDLVVCTLIEETLKGLKMSFPKLPKNERGIAVK
ncbi:MAG TPA: PPK2 family polyphosphate kinase [Nitrososphaerales archaeon]|nr:PPK2 family polyphosphate kinase [Nitrososphaerales archaeon]